MCMFCIMLGMKHNEISASKVVAPSPGALLGREGDLSGPDQQLNQIVLQIAQIFIYQMQREANKLRCQLRYKIINLKHIQKFWCRVQRVLWWTVLCVCDFVKSKARIPGQLCTKILVFHQSKWYSTVRNAGGGSDLWSRDLYTTIH